MEQYSIGVSGKLAQGFEHADVQQKLAALFKCSPEKALRLIFGKPVLSYWTKYNLNHLATEFAHGARCYVQQAMAPNALNI